MKFVAIDMSEANDVTIHIMAAFAEHEAKRISEGTKKALAAAKARGVVLGETGPGNLRQTNDQRRESATALKTRLAPVIEGFVGQGLTRRQIVGQLNSGPSRSSGKPLVAGAGTETGSKVKAIGYIEADGFLQSVRESFLSSSTATLSHRPNSFWAVSAMSLP